MVVVSGLAMAVVGVMELSPVVGDHEICVALPSAESWTDLPWQITVSEAFSDSETTLAAGVIGPPPRDRGSGLGSR